jgi:hypothetical protein
MFGKWQGSDILKLRFARSFTSNICVLARWVSTHDEKVCARPEIAMTRPSRKQQYISFFHLYDLPIGPAQH